MTGTPDQSDSPFRGHGGSLADMVTVPARPESTYTFSRTAWIKIALLAGMLILMNYRQFPRLFWTWVNDKNWSHGFIIPLFSLYLLFDRRDEILRAKPTTCLWGLLVLVVAALLETMAYADGNPWACQIGMLMIAFGLVFYLAGPKIMRLTWLPIFYLVFAFPVPNIYYTRVAVWLQNLAAALSASVLRLFTVVVEVKQSSLSIVSITGVKYPLLVEEACSGMRLIMAFLALGVAMAYLTDRPLWQRVVLVALAVPIAVMCNILRVVITCTMFVIDIPQLGQKIMHEFTGMLMLIPAIGMLWGMGWLLRHLFVDVDEVVDVDEARADLAGQGQEG